MVRRAPELAERITLLRDRCEQHGRRRNAVEVAIEFSVTVGASNEAAESRYMASGLVANAGSTPGTSTSGVSLKPGAVYKHVASGSTRTTVKTIDIGAYESAL